MMLQQVNGRSANMWRYPELQGSGLGTVMYTASYSLFMKVVMREDWDDFSSLFRVSSYFQTFFKKKVTCTMCNLSR